MACGLTCSVPACKLPDIGWLCEADLGGENEDAPCYGPAAFHKPHPDEPEGTVVCSYHEED